MYHDIIQWSATILQFESICFSFQKVSIQRQFSSLKSIQRRFLKTVHHLRRFESTTKLIEERSVGLTCFFVGNGKLSDLTCLLLAPGIMVRVTGVGS